MGSSSTLEEQLFLLRLRLSVRFHSQSIVTYVNLKQNSNALETKKSTTLCLHTIFDPKKLGFSQEKQP